jgi:hypothetical protein
MRPVNKPAPQNPVIKKGWTTAEVVESALLDTLGAYCSFCELSIEGGGLIQTKQSGKLLRSPSLTEWPELMLTCPYCNTWRTPGSVNEAEYLWPDVDSTFTLTPTSPLLYQLKDVAVVQQGTSSTQQLVIVAANPASPSSTQSKAQNTIDLYQLNSPYYDAKTNTMTLPAEDVAGFLDFRVTYRTREWLRALTAVDSLKQALQLNFPGVVDAFVKSVAIMAQASAFWSVWMTTFWQAFQNEDLLRRLFISTTNRKGYMITGYQSAYAALNAPAKPVPYLIFCGTAAERIQFPPSPATASGNRS